MSPTLGLSLSYDQEDTLIQPEYELGRTRRKITQIGLGCWQFSGGRGVVGGFWRGLTQDEVNEIVGAAIDEGITWFDTAEAYGRGFSERSLSAALVAKGIQPGKVIIATKWFPILRTARSITSTFPIREQALSPYSVDLHQVHNPAGLSSVEKEMKAMANLASEGRLSAVGVSNFGEPRMRAAHRALEARGLPLASNQVRYSLLDRNIESNGVLEAAQELGVTVIAYSPLSQGILSGKYHEDPDAVRRLHGPRKHWPQFRKRSLANSRPLIDELRLVADEHDATPAQVALAWVVQRNGDTVVAIPGASTVSQVRSNAAAMHLQLGRDEINRLDSVSSATVDR